MDYGVVHIVGPAHLLVAGTVLALGRSGLGLPRRLALDGPCLYSIYSRPIIYDSASMIKLKL